MKSKSTASVIINLALALGVFAFGALRCQAAVSFQTFNISSGYAWEGIGISYNFTTLSAYDSGEQVGAVMARSGFDPEFGFLYPSILNGDYNGGLNQAKVSATSVSFGTTIDSSLTWSARINLPQGRGDTFYGIRFDNGAGSFSYGWLKLNTLGTDVNFISAGVEQALNTAITAGSVSSVPEPGTAGAIAAVAAAALVVLRRRQHVG